MSSVPSQLLHDLRSPLNQIIGYSEILTEEVEGPGSEGFVTDLQKIRSAGLSMLAIIEQNFTPHDGSAAVSFEEPDGDITVTGSVEQPVALEPGLLLVVDDDADNRDVLSRRLTRQGHNVRTASSGAEALRAMRASPFDLVLLDIMMPDMDGYEVLGRIKTDRQLAHVPVIMISALSEVQSVVRCIEAGADDYLSKPFNPTLLKARIGASLERKRSRDRESLMFEELQTNYDRLQELEKRRDDMRNMIVHDLRTPLTSVLAGVAMLEKHGELNDTQRDMMSIAVRNGQKLVGMINDLLDVEKIESGAAQLHFEKLSPAALVANALEQTAWLAEDEKTSLVSEIAPGLADFTGDQNKVSRTLVNLVANAIKFTRAGTVTIAVSAGDTGDIRFAVRDTGEGIPAEALGRIFEKFGQLDSRRAGTGLGLAFCRLVVEAHGGTITVESTPGIGSTFAFTIPVSHGPAPRAHTA